MSEEEECSICGLNLTDKFCHKLKCSHVFHYECLMKTFIHLSSVQVNGRNCPYCRSKCDYLPLVNGLKRTIISVHFGLFSGAFPKNILKQEYNDPCKFILTRGKNKGNGCGKNCSLGYEYCKSHKDKVK